MKRSEMIKYISRIILDNDTEFHLSEKEADLLLSHLEKAGMKPPSVDIDRCHALIQLYIAPNYDIWDEDFEKDTEAVEAYNRRMERKKRKYD